MKRIVTILLCLFATISHAAGIKFADVPASAEGPALKAVIWTPCALPAEPMALGPFVLSGKHNCPTVGENLPLVVISHGHGGSLLNHYDLAERLADSGFIVAAISHPGDTHADMSRSEDESVFVERPMDIKRLIDYMLSASLDAHRIDSEKIGFFGFSRGGYTGLVLAGGNPDFLHANLHCPDPAFPICKQLRRKIVPRGPLTHDPRIKAYVLADPFDVFPTAKSVRDIKAPIQLWASQFGGEGVLPEAVHQLARLLPNAPDFHVVPEAAHFAFLPPCTPQFANSAPALCVDRTGFDRVTFHHAFNEEVLRFFQTHVQ